MYRIMLRKVLLMAGVALALQAGAQEPATPAPAVSPSATGSTPGAAKKHHASKQDREAAQKAFLEGAKDLEHEDAQAAMDAFAHAVELDPGNRRYSLSEEVARQRLVWSLIQQADKAKILGHLDESHQKVAEAYHLDPHNPIVTQHMNELASTTVAGEPALRTDADATAAPIEFRPKPGRISFHLHTDERSVIRQVLSAYGIQATVDDSVLARPVRYDVDDADFAEARRTLALATNTFVVPLDPARALVAKESRENRAKFDRVALETVYMPGMANDELSQIVNIAKSVFSMPTAYAEQGQTAITVRGPATDMAALNETLKSLLEGRGEVQLDVAMYEVDRTKATNLGLILPTQTSVFNVYSEASSLLQSNSSLVQQIISSGLAAPGDWEAILAILVASGQISNSLLSQPFGVFGGGLSMTGITYQGGSLNMQLNSSDVHAVDEMQLRVLDHEDATIRAGERYPIETSSYSSLSATPLSIPGISSAGLSSTLQNLGVNPAALASAASETIPQVQYQDIGLTLKATPHMEGEHDVSLKLDLQLSSLGGSAINGLPVLNNREFAAIDSLRVGESAIMVSSLSRQESDAITGIPGLSEIPGFQDTTNKNNSLDVSELAVVITPHIVRAAHLQNPNKMLLISHHP